MAKTKTPLEAELQIAVNNYSVADARKLLDSNPTEFDEMKNDDRYLDFQLLMEAVSKPSVDLAKLLIAKGFRVYRKSDENQSTVLECAVRTNNKILIRILLENGASLDILTANEQNRTPFHLAIDKNWVKTIDMFMDYYDAKTLNKEYYLHYAVKNGKMEVVQHLVKKGFSAIVKDEKNLTPISIVMKDKRWNSLQILDLLLSHYQVKNINPNNYEHMAPIYIAIIRNNLKVIQKYADSNLPINNVLKPKDSPWYGLKDYSGYTLLHFAVIHNNLEIVEFLLSKKAIISIKIANGLSPLHIAFGKKDQGIGKAWIGFENNNNCIIDSMLRAHLQDKSNPVDKNGLSHFHIACSRDEPTVVKHFLRFGASINQAVIEDRFKGFSPLHFAAKFRCVKVLELLLKNGADVKQKDSNGMTALHVAAKNPCAESVPILLKYGADISLLDSNGNSPVHLAFKLKNYELIDLLISVQNGALSNPVNNEGLSHFHIACTRDRVNIVEKFIKKGVALNVCALPKKTDKNKDLPAFYWSGYSPLHFAVAHNKVKIVELLLKKGIDANLEDVKGLTPLHLACKHTSALFEEFIKNTLHQLSKCGKIVSKPQPVTDVSDVDEEYFDGFVSSTDKIDWITNRTDHLKVINLLLSHGSDINILDKNGHSPVLHACAASSEFCHELDDTMQCAKKFWAEIHKSLTSELYERRKLILNEFLKLDINLDKCYKRGSILHYICSTNKEDVDEIMEKFLKKGANVDAINDGSTPLEQAIVHNNRNLAKMLLEYGANVNNVSPKSNLTPLLTATSNFTGFKYSVDIIKKLIDKGANVFARTSDGETVLHNLPKDKDFFQRYVIDGYNFLIAILIKAGVDVNSQDSKGRTLLHVACSEGPSQIIEELLKHGADINIEDNENKTIFCYMYENGPTYLIRYFRKHIMKMKLVGLPMSQRAQLSYEKFIIKVQNSCNRGYLLSDEEQQIFNGKCKLEVKKLQDTKIYGNCTLYDVIFKSYTSMPQLANNCTFKKIVKSKLFKETYPEYGYLIQLKYKAGLNRSILLQTANSFFNKLSKQSFPLVCSEHICQYFNNAELRESVNVLSRLFNCNEKSSDDDKRPETCNTNKRQKLC